MHTQYAKNIKYNKFLQVFNFVKDESIPGRWLNIIIFLWAKSLCWQKVYVRNGFIAAQMQRTHFLGKKTPKKLVCIHKQHRVIII